MCRFVAEIGLISQRLDPHHSSIGKLASKAGSGEYIDGPVFIMGSSITSQLEMEHLESAASTVKPLFTIAVFPFGLTFYPGKSFNWTQQIVIDSATIGDVFVGKWKVWASGHITLRFSSNAASTPPVTLSDIYEEMGWHHRTPFGISSTIRNSSSSVGRIITTHSRDGPRRYSIHSQVQACDLSYQLPHMLVAWPVVDGTGVEPTPAQKVVASGGHHFWLSKSQQDDFYTLDAFSLISSSKVWMWVLNAFANAAHSNTFDAWSVFAHVSANSRRAEDGYYRNGGRKKLLPPNQEVGPPFPSPLFSPFSVS